MTLHARLVTAVTVLSIVLLGVALSAVWLAVGAAQREQPDANLRAAAIEEAHEVAVRGGRTLTLGLRERRRRGRRAPRTPPSPNTPSSTVPTAPPWLLRATCRTRSPTSPRFRSPKNTCFDFHIGSEQARGILVDVPRHPGSRLLIGASRADIDREISFLGRALFIAFAAVVVFTALFAAQIVRKFTHGYDAIATVTRRVADGDLSARVDTIVGSTEFARLQVDINRMITQLESLFGSQRRFVGSRRARAALAFDPPLRRALARASSHANAGRVSLHHRASARRDAAGSSSWPRTSWSWPGSTRRPTNPGETFRSVEVHGERRTGHRSTTSREAGGARVQGAPTSRCARAARISERMLRNLLENAVRHSTLGRQGRGDRGHLELGHRHLRRRLRARRAGRRSTSRFRALLARRRSASERRTGSRSRSRHRPPESPAPTAARSISPNRPPAARSFASRCRVRGTPAGTQERR